MKKGTVGILSLLAGAIGGLTGGAIGVSEITSKEMTRRKQMSDKHLALFLMMNQWVKVKQAGKNLSSYFEKKGYRKIAIYGMSYAGETLTDELTGTGVQVIYCIDNKVGMLHADVDIVSMDDDLQPVDVVVVTAITFFDEIEKKLSKKVSCPIISLEDILYEV